MRLWLSAQAEQNALVELVIKDGRIKKPDPKSPMHSGSVHWRK
jgi:hypothetical protein